MWLKVPFHYRHNPAISRQCCLKSTFDMIKVDVHLPALWALCLRGWGWRCCLIHRSSRWLCCKYITLSKAVLETIQKISLNPCKQTSLKPMSVILWNIPLNQKRTHSASYSCTNVNAGWSSPKGPQWPADHGQLQIRNTQVEKKLFYACPRCQGANSECNPTCNTCSSPNYRVILAGQNLANFCKVGIGSDSEANSWERPQKYFISFVTQYLMQDILFGRNAHCSISKLRGLWGFSKSHQRTFYSLTKTNNCFSQFSGLTGDPQKALGIREAYIDVQKHRPALVLMDLSLRQRINRKTSSVEPNNHPLTWE